MFPSGLFLRLWRWLPAFRRRILISLLVAGVAPAFAANDASAVEYQVKAAYLYRMAEYVEWPSSAFERPDEPIRVAVVGSDALAEILAGMLAGRTANHRGFVVRPAAVGDDIEGAHIVFVGRREAASLKKVLGSLKSRPVLTVTETPDGLDNGSVVNFVPLDNRIGFEISLGAAERNGLKLSSRLLAVARRVEKVAP